MTVDQLDALGRRAAADLRDRTRDVDTEEALDRLTARTGGVRHRAVRLRRPALVAAAVLAVTGGGLLLASRGEAPRETTIASMPEREPESYGPVVATSTGPTGERYELRAHEPLHHGDEVLVSVSGATPGHDLNTPVCLLDDLFNPMTHCDVTGGGDRQVVDRDGTASRVLRVHARFDGAGGSRWANRCGATTCAVWVSTVDGSGAEVSGAVPPPEDHPKLPLRFAEDAGGPVEPTMSVEPVVGVPSAEASPNVTGGLTRIRATGLAPGRTEIAVTAYPGDRLPPPLQFVGAAGRVVVATVEVGSDGTLDVMAPVPLVVEPQPGTQDPSVPDPLVCGEAGVTCDLRIGYPPGAAPLVAPEPVPLFPG